MDAASGTRTVNILAFSSTKTRRMPNSTNLAQQALQASPSMMPEMLGLYSSSKSTSLRFPAERRHPCLKSRNTSALHLVRCSMKPGIGSNNSARNRNPAIELDKDSIAQELEASSPNRSLESCSRGLVFDLGPESSWDNIEIGSPVVKRYLGDNEERWHMWYHGRGSGKDSADYIGLAVSSNGIHWSRAAEHARSSATEGMVMDCSKNWWAFDTKSIRPAEMTLMSSPMYSAVYWLYYTGYSSDEVDLSGATASSLGNPERHRYEENGAESDANRKFLKSLPGLACSQDGRHWARIEGDHHSGALLDVGTDTDWDSLFIASPQVVIHDNDDLRMYYYSFEKDKGQFSLGLARSRDGIRWIKCGKIMGGGSSGAFDELGVKNACVIRNTKGENYFMAYEGVAADGKRSIGMAVSPDGLKNWTRLQEGPVLQPSEEDGWDNVGVGSPCLVRMEDNYDEWRLYYQGFGQGGRTGIGMATSQGCNVGSFRRWSGISA